MPKIKRDLLTLKECDVWSLVLFALYKFKDVPEYSSISELIYVLDKDNMLKLCEYFGGLTITIPTINELETIVKALILYQYTVIDGNSYDWAIKQLGEADNTRAVKAAYVKVCEVLSEYEFSARSDIQ